MVSEPFHHLPTRAETPSSHEIQPVRKQQTLRRVTPQQSPNYHIIYAALGVAVRGHDDNEYYSPFKNLPDQSRYPIVPSFPVRKVPMPPHYHDKPITVAKYVTISSNNTTSKGDKTFTIFHLNQTILPSAPAEREDKLLVVCDKKSVPSVLERNVPL